VSANVINSCQQTTQCTSSSSSSYINTVGARGVPHAQPTHHFESSPVENKFSNSNHDNFINTTKYPKKMGYLKKGKEKVKKEKTSSARA
jgi:hypothetical protein